VAGSLSSEARDAVRKEARAFLARHKILLPPFPVDLALKAQQLRLAEVSLEEALRRIGADGPELDKIDAMLDVTAKSVALREDLHRHGKKWGCVHEVAHSVLPWHADLLYYCPIILLPARVQRQMELEADAFTSDCLFLGSRFTEEAKAVPVGIRPIIQLADAYGASITSALRRYVEENPDPCCLLVWKCPEGPEADENATLSLHYFVRSPSSGLTFRIGQTVGKDHVVAQAYLELRDTATAAIQHELSNGRTTYTAETFFNSYSLFTLLWSPRPAPS